MAIQVRQVDDSETARFVRVHHDLYAGDPAFRAPRDRDVMRLLDPRANPWFRHGQMACFVAERDGVAVGRISAQWDPRSVAVHAEAVGSFGFFECVDDAKVASALIERAEAWVGERGASALRGPVHQSVSQAAGVLVDGFEHPNYVGMWHGRPYYAALIEEAGYAPEIDLYAWRYGRVPVPKQVRMIADAVVRRDGLVMRPIDPSDFDAELDRIVQIYNDAYAKSWGFAPLNTAEMAFLLRDGEALDPRVSLIAEVDGEPAAVAIGLPNTNELAEDLEGRLYPLGWLKKVLRAYLQRPLTLRQVFFGIRERYRGNALGGLAPLMYTSMRDAARAAGYQEIEVTWTTAIDQRVNGGLMVVGAERYKTYRVFRRTLDAADN